VGLFHLKKTDATQRITQQFDYTKNLLKYFENTILSRKFMGRPVRDAQSCITIRITTIENVANMVGTFLNKDG